MSDHTSSSVDRTLYDALAEPAAPTAGPRGETAITATKETIDNDQEAEQTIILLGGH